MNFDSLVDDSAKAQSLPAQGGNAPLSFDQLQDDSEKYGGTAGGFKAAGLGLARSASFGLSDEFLAHSGLMKAEDIKAYKEQNPLATTAGEVGGVLGALLAPEVGLVGAISAPVRGVARLGTAITEAALPASKAISGLVAGAESSPVINKILSQAGALAAGSAVEGAAYGLGQNITEHALGNPDLNAESVVASIGQSALTGAALGSIFGAAKGAVQAKFPKFISEVDKAGIDSGDFKAMVNASDMPEETKKGFFNGLTKLKPNAKEIEAAAADIGAPVLPGQISANKTVQDAQDLLLSGAPSVPGFKARELAEQGFERAAQAVDSTLGTAEGITKANLGDTLKEIVSKTVQKQVEPINALYDTLKSEYQTLPVSEKALKQIAANIRRIEDVPLSPQARSIAEGAAERLESIKTVDDIKRLRSIINQELSPATATPIQKRVTAIIGDKLANLEESSIVRFAEKEMKTAKAKDRILQLLDQRASANKQYAEFRGKLDEFGKAMGRKRVHGAQDFLDFLDEMTPEKVADKLSTKGNSQFLEFFSKEVPEGMAAISGYQKGLIREAALKDGKINIKSALKAVDKMPKEYREKIFSAQELDKLSKVRTYIDSFPEKFNPSGTSGATAFREFFESPAKATIANIRDFGMQSFIDAATQGGDNASSFIDGLSKIERGAQKTAKAINSGVNSIFSKDLGTPAKGFFLSSSERREDHDKTKALVSDLNTNPEKMIEHLQSNTDAIAAFAPKTAAGIQNTMVRASQFLNSKLPGQNVPTKPLSAPYKASEAELSKWHKYFSAVTKPTDILHSVAAGNLVPEQVEAVSVVYPKLMQQMQSAVMDKMTEHVAKEKTIPYRTKLSLSLFMGTDLVNSLNSVSMLANQNMMATATQAKAHQEMISAKSKTGDKLTKSSDLMTPMQKTAHRGEA